MKIESNNMNNENKYCEEIELLVDDYLDGMITSEDRQKMEQHLSECSGCRKYIEETVFLMEKAVLLSKTDNIISDGKKAEMWDKIEAKLNAADSKETTGTHIYSMSGLEDKSPAGSYEPVSTVEYIPPKPGVWNSMRYYMSGLAAVIVLAFVIYGVNQFMKRSGDINISGNDVVEIGGPKWMVTSIKGSPMINNMVMKAIDSLGVGGFITTNDSSKAELYVAGLGTVTIEPGSKVRLIKSVEGEHRIALDYGSIDASILAKPRTFFVDAGNVTAVDLGCSYKFSVDEGGDGLLYVRSGMVSLESASGRQSLVPEGKYCVTKQNIGPGTPFREDSSPQLKKALMEFDFGNCGGECVNVILKNAKKTDAVTLVNILPRVDEQYKKVVYQKAATYCRPPVNMRRDSVQNMENAEHLNEWVDKIMEEVHQNIQENISRVEKQINEQMKQFDEEKFQREWQKNWDKNVKKNWNFNYNFDHNFKGIDTLNLNIPDTPSLEELEDLNQELEELHQELKVDNEEFRREMEKVREEMNRVNEEIRKEMEKTHRETEKEMRKEMEKEKKRREKEGRSKDNNNEDNDSGEDRD